MANLKNITDLPVVESVEGLNLIVNDNGSAKQVPATAIGGKGVSSWNDLSDKPTESIEGVETLKEEIIPDTIARVSALSSYALKSEIPSVDGLATEEFVEAQTTGMAEKSHTHSWDDISDQPFGDTIAKGETIIATLTVPVFTGTSHSISDSGILSYSEGTIFAVEFDGKLYGCTLTLIGGSSPTRYQFAAGNLSMAKSSLEDNGLPFCLYGARGESGCKIFIKDKTVSHVLGAYKGAVGVNTIDEKFIPDTIARVEDLPEMPKITAEDWVFTLEDGSTVTKKVAVMS